MKLVLAGAAVAALAGCAEVGTPLATNVPVMVGPVTRIGGRPAPQKEIANEKLRYDSDDENSLWICWASGYPSASRTAPSVLPFVGQIGSANAELAGSMPLRNVTARLDRVSVGSYVWFGGGCYGHAWWWTAHGGAETP